MKYSGLHTVLMFLAACAVTGISYTVEAQTLISPDPESKIWIEGRSNVSRFTCNAQKYEGGIVVKNENPDQIHSFPAESVILELRIPVRSFECGRKRMNRDMYQALKSDDYIYISFEFMDARTLSEEPENGIYNLEVHGLLTVAGISREIIFTAVGYLLENRLRVTGQKEIRMTDYNVEPPTGMLGLIQAENELVVHFDLFASPEEDSTLFKAQR